MILGLCGLAGAGKDTVADFLVKDHGFVKVAFADPLKRICKEVFDFTDQQLWGPSSERNKSDERYPRQVSCHWSRTEGSEPFTCQYCGERTESAVAMMERACPARAFLTPRHALQQLGTEWGRECYPNIWAEYALRVADKLLHKSGILRSVHYHYDQMDGLQSTSVPLGPKPKGVVIPDVRFQSEVDAIRTAGGFVWKIERPTAGLQGAAAAHVSEQEHLSIPPESFSFLLNNKNGPLPELEQLVTAALQGTLRLFDQK